ncbi:hypothetical protein AM571_PA00111 (plasmid) [Rhizobium etli 8C-3]|uniref:Uncharacterized protein n=1 Tax=Rhizobium etli 8C-3 TaxID=538025 RepID=A0A1L5PA13_RHIET|nr:hypothetical protein AM571_PA00111 [Rhizobium etli 8C-3]
MSIGQGTIGGRLMDVGFRHLRRVDGVARAWAFRLFSLTIGSWLYWMEYGLWFLLFPAPL